MSETSILPGAELPAGADGAGGGQGGYPGGGWDDAGGDNRRRNLIIGGAVAAVVLLLVVAYFVLHGGGGSSNTPTGAVPRGTPPAAVVVSPTPSPSTSASPKAGSKGGVGTKLPKKSKTRLARDPFKALITAATSGTSLGAASVPGGEGGFTFPSGGATSGGTPTQVPASDGPPLWVELIKVNGESDATIDVGYAQGKKFRFDVTAPSASSVQGTVFDEEFSLLGIQNGEVTLQVGDATPFDLRPGVSHPV